MITAMMIPCRVCHAAPGTPCWSEHREGDFHATRENDAVLSARFLEDRIARPLVQKRTSHG